MNAAQKGRERKRFRRRLASKGIKALHRAETSKQIRMRGCGGMSYAALGMFKAARVSADIARKALAEKNARNTVVPPSFG